MDDIGAPPYNSSQIELWVHQEITSHKTPEMVADLLLRHWDQGKLTVDGKHIVAVFCLHHGFVASLTAILKKDLSLGHPLPWGIMARVVLPQLIHKSAGEKAPLEERNTVDALLTGATRDKQLFECAAEALALGHSDPRWLKIHLQELKDKMQAVHDKRDQIFKDLKIFQSERMESDVRECIQKILQLFPDDKEALALVQTLEKKSIGNQIEKIRSLRKKKTPATLQTPPSTWPELAQVLTALKPRLDLNQAYYLSTALHQMELHEFALSILREKQPNWEMREKLWNIELLLANHFFAEALGEAQKLLGQHAADPEVTPAALYYSAKAYHGLEDDEQGRSILKALLKYDPHYRDASVLLLEWEDDLI